MQFQGLDFWSICAGGGSNRVTLSGGEGQGNDGTSLPCKGCFVIGDSANTAAVRMRIGTDCTSTTGTPIPEFGTDHYIRFVPINDLNKLYFYSSDATAIVDIEYLR